MFPGTLVLLAALNASSPSAPPAQLDEDLDGSVASLQQQLQKARDELRGGDGLDRMPQIPPRVPVELGCVKMMGDVDPKSLIWHGRDGIAHQSVIMNYDGLHPERSGVIHVSPRIEPCDQPGSLFDLHSPRAGSPLQTGK